MLLGGVAVLAVGAAGTAYALNNSKTPTTTATSQLPTALVERKNMTNTIDADGTLGYGDGYTVLAGGGGRITWLPTAGSVIKRGQRAYGVDGYSVPLFYGSTPLWRTLRSGVSNGVDVLELERNLVALKYGKGLDVDRTFTWETAEAVRDWQEDLGRKRTGVVAPTDVVMLATAIRVVKVQAVLAGPANGTVYTASDTQRRVTVALPVSEAQTVARKGAKVRVTLPGDKEATGKITAIASVATGGTTNSQSQTGQSTEDATIAVTITLDQSAEASTLDGAPAVVHFPSTVHKDVLAVPINALLAASDATYSVNVVDADGTVRSVPVKLGIFDGDRVEVTGELTPGQKVQVPRS
ncbi:efflux RND transporter periplasmic adaptor subunit [Luedemannella flava]|uniref:efflux RND transporter periplasmic adaptor subunit n=1 Tax=Luedemannella flava TaxID=349316 RepID=UPI0031E0D1B9